MRLTSRIPDYALVTLTTLLIWLYAEGQNVATFVPPQPVPIRVSLTADDMVVVDQQPERVIPRFKGSTNALDKLKRVLRGGFRLEVTDTEPGVRGLVLSRELRASDPISEMNVNLISVEPEMMRLEIDRLAKREVAVRFEPRNVRLADGVPRVKPAQVTLTAPEGLLRRGGIDLSNLVLDAEPINDLADLPRGTPQKVRARIVLPEALRDDPHVRVSPAEAELSFTIDRNERTTVLPSVPVEVVALPSDMAHYTVRLAEESVVLRDVEVSGPAELIRRLQDREAHVYALLRLDGEELARLAGQEAAAPVAFDTPDGVRVHENATVRFRVRRNDRENAETAPDREGEGEDNRGGEEPGAAPLG